MATRPADKFYFDARDGTIARVSKDVTEVLQPDGKTWKPYQADLIHDYVPVDPADLEGLIKRVYAQSQDAVE